MDANRTIAAEPLSLGRLQQMVSSLGQVDRDLTDAERVDQLRALEKIKAAAAAAQAQLAVDLADSQEAEQAAAGVRRDRVGRGVAAQIGLATRQSPHRARRFLSLSRVLVAELPHTYAALTQGHTTEYRAMILARETLWLSRVDRARVDADLGPRLHGLGDVAVEQRARALAQRLDPAGAVARAAQAVGDRRVTIRPAPDTMVRLSALLPVAQGVAAYAALSQAADAARAAGDSRSRGQVMADELITRTTGTHRPEQTPVMVHLTVPEETLLRGGADPAHLHGYGPVPAGLARDWIRNDQARIWIRRCYTRHGRLVALESASREFPASLRRFLVIRDQHCRTPWCRAPIRHADHITPAQHGGPTSIDNGQGLCEACNYAKQAPGWSQLADPNGPTSHVSHIITSPTRHTYRSRPPDLVPRPTAGPPTFRTSWQEILSRAG